MLIPPVFDKEKRQKVHKVYLTADLLYPGHVCLLCSGSAPP